MKALRFINLANDRVAVVTVKIAATMWCAYAFTVLSVVPVLAPKIQGQILYLSNCLQLVALPVIMVGQAVLSRDADRQRAQDHEALQTLIRELHDHFGIKA